MIAIWKTGKWQHAKENQFPYGAGAGVGFLYWISNHLLHENSVFLVLKELPYVYNEEDRVYDHQGHFQLKYYVISCQEKST